MSEALPRLLLVTDADLSAGSQGAGRALVSLFAPYPAGSLLALSGSATTRFTMGGGHSVLAAAPPIPGRIVDALRHVVGDVDALWSRWMPTFGLEDVAAFSPQLVLAAPTSPVGLALADRFASAAPVVTFLMDDWFDYLSSRPFAFDTPRRGRALLRASCRWLAISPDLAAAMRTATGVDRPTLVVQNPVRLGAGEPAALAAPRAGRFRIAYSGSVWPMHFDALAAVAESVARLRAEGTDIEFVLRTSPFFWQRHAAELQRWGVVGGGFVPYEDLVPALGEADLLLVASSFDAAQAHMSRSSVQAKVTDYMASGRPILACGPEDAASNRFLRERDCAYFATDPSPGAVDAVLRACVASRNEGPTIARRAWEVALRDHEIGVVTGTLYEFLRKTMTVN